MSPTEVASYIHRLLYDTHEQFLRMSHEASFVEALIEDDLRVSDVYAHRCAMHQLLERIKKEENELASQDKTESARLNSLRHEAAALCSSYDNMTRDTTRRTGQLLASASSIERH